MPIVIRDRATLADLKRVAAIQNLGVAALIDVLVMREASRITGEPYAHLLARTRRDYRRQLNDADVSATGKVSIRKTLRQIRQSG